MCRESAGAISTNRTPIPGMRCESGSGGTWRTTTPRALMGRSPAGPGSRMAISTGDATGIASCSARNRPDELMSLSRPRRRPWDPASCTQPRPARRRPRRWATPPSVDRARSRAPLASGLARAASAPAAQQPATSSIVVTTSTGIDRRVGSAFSARTQPGPSSSGFCASRRMRSGVRALALRTTSGPSWARTISHPDLILLRAHAAGTVELRLLRVEEDEVGCAGARLADHVGSVLGPHDLASQAPDEGPLQNPEQSGVVDHQHPGERSLHCGPVERDDAAGEVRTWNRRYGSRFSVERYHSRACPIKARRAAGRPTSGPLIVRARIGDPLAALGLRGGRRPSRPLRRPFERDAQPLHLLDESGALDLEQLRGAGLHPPGVLESLVQHPLFVVRQDLIQGESIPADVKNRHLDHALVQDLARQVLRAELLLAERQRHRPFDHVLELPHVSRP